MSSASSLGGRVQYRIKVSAVAVGPLAQPSQSATGSVGEAHICQHAADTRLTPPDSDSTSLMPVTDDVFCQIGRGDVDAAVVLRTDDVIAFLDHRPVFKGHVLIAPLEHVDTLLDLPQDLMEPLLTSAQHVARALVDALGAQGTFVAINNVVSQSVPHLHMHLVPRSRGDGLRGFFWPRTRYGTGEMEEYAAKIKKALSYQSD
jgi:histidine triad (HIT) family protein